MEQKPAPIPVKTPELEASFAYQGQVEVTDFGCHIWQGPRYPHGGYGRFYVPSGELNIPGKTYRAHRVAYAWAFGDTEFILDHLCHDPIQCQLDARGWCIHRACVNPEHLEPTTRGENVRRGIPGSPLWHPLGNTLKQICDHGHEFTEENTYVNPRGERQCRTCARETTRRYNDRNREIVNARKRERRERIVYDERPCQNCGLPFTPEKSTGRFCTRRACVNDRQRINRLRRLGR